MEIFSGVKITYKIYSQAKNIIGRPECTVSQIEYDSQFQSNTVELPLKRLPKFGRGCMTIPQGDLVPNTIGHFHLY